MRGRRESRGEWCGARGEERILDTYYVSSHHIASCVFPCFEGGLASIHLYIQPCSGETGRQADILALQCFITSELLRANCFTLYCISELWNGKEARGKGHEWNDTNIRWLPSCVFVGVFLCV